jgi:peptidoglycan-associated lipoprotein
MTRRSSIPKALGAALFTLGLLAAAPAWTQTRPTAPAQTPGEHVGWVRIGKDAQHLPKTELALINETAGYLKDRPESRVRLIGHTDAGHAPEAALALGAQHAERVARELIAQGVATGRIERQSIGRQTEGLPVAYANDNAVQILLIHR